jgi:hypothetical protein
MGIAVPSRKAALRSWNVFSYWMSLPSVTELKIVLVAARMTRRLNIMKRH